MIVTAPEPLRKAAPAAGGQAARPLQPPAPHQLNTPTSSQPGSCCAASPAASRQQHVEADELEREILAHVRALAPALLDEPGVGPIVAAQLIVAWSHRGRLRSEACFARLAGVAPVPASSGQTIRHRLSRGGDRQLNRALHTIVLHRRQHDPATRDYIARRVAEGKTRRDATRLLKRYLARHLYRVLNNSDAADDLTVIGASFPNTGAADRHLTSGAYCDDRRTAPWISSARLRYVVRCRDVGRPYLARRHARNRVVGRDRARRRAAVDRRHGSCASEIITPPGCATRARTVPRTVGESAPCSGSFRT